MEGKQNYHRRSITYTPDISQHMYPQNLQLSNDSTNSESVQDKCRAWRVKPPVVTTGSENFLKRADSGLHCPESGSFDCDQIDNDLINRPDAKSVWSKLNVTSTELRRCAAEVVSLRTEKFALLRERGEMLEKIEVLTRVIDKNESLAENSNESLKANFQLRLSTLEAEVQSLQQKNDKLNARNQELVQQLAKSGTLSGNSDLGKYISRIDVLQKSLEAREGDIIELRTANSSIAEKFNNQIEELFASKEQYRMEAEALRAKLFKMETKTDKKTQVESKIVEELTNERNRLRIELEKIQAHVKDYMDICSLCGIQRDENYQAESDAEAWLVKKIKALQQRLQFSEIKRKEMLNKLQDIRGNIRVFVRCRPFLISDSCNSPDEVPQFHSSLHFHQDKISVSLIPSAIASITYSTNSRGMHGSLNNPFLFDRTFNVKSSQEEVYDEVSDLVQSALDGYRVCIISYGQSGSGKTHTMLGGAFSKQNTGKHDWGIVPRAFDDILSQSQAMRLEGWEEISISVSIIELYNEEINDLLDGSCGNMYSNASVGSGSRFKINRVNHRVVVSGLTSVQIDNSDSDVGMSQFADLLSQSAAARTTASTGMNEVSSRSHLIVMIEIQGRHSDGVTVMQGGLRLCDLAGSERLDRTGNLNDANRLREAVNINKSLSCLSDVFLALNNKAAYVPHRNSKLTMLLQDCLSGEGRTLLIVNVSPTMASTHETLCSLRFANQVSQIELGKAEKHVYTIIDPNSFQQHGESAKDTMPFKLSSPPPSNTRSQAQYHKRTISVGSPAMAAAATHINALSAPRSHHRRNYSAEVSGAMSANRGVSEEKENKSPMPVWGLSTTAISFKSPPLSSAVRSSKGGEHDAIDERLSVSAAPAATSPGENAVSTPLNPNHLSATPHNNNNNNAATPINTPKTASTKLRSAPSSALKVVPSSSTRNGGISLIPTPLTASGKSRRKVLDGTWKVLFDTPNFENGEPNQLQPENDNHCGCHQITISSACSSLSSSQSSDSTISTVSGTFPTLPPDAANSAAVGVAFSAKTVADPPTTTIKCSSPMRVSNSAHPRHSIISGSPMVKSSPMRPVNKNWCM